jgi:hypothetical protein
MSASGTLSLQTSVFLTETRIFRACQEIRNLLAHGRRRESSASGPTKTFSATVAGAWPSTITLAAGSPTDRTQIHFSNAGQPCPPRRAVRKPQTHAKPRQTQQRTPAIREIVVAAAHAEGKTAVIMITTPNAAATKAGIPKVADLKDANPMVASQAEADAMAANPAARTPESPSAARCPLPSSSAGGRSC